MSRGSWIHDEVVWHFGTLRLAASCTQCAGVGAEQIRTAQPPKLRKTIPEETFAKMCLAGRGIYGAYLRWLAEPDE